VLRSGQSPPSGHTTYSAFFSDPALATASTAAAAAASSETDDEAVSSVHGSDWTADGKGIH